MNRTDTLTAALLALLPCAACRGADVVRTNLLPNPGFEQDRNADGVPDGWTFDAAEEETGAVVLDQDERHGGRRSVRIRHGLDASYSKIRGPGFKPTQPDTRAVASVWVRVDWDDRIRTSVPGANGVKLYIGNEKGSTVAASRKILDTSGKWQRVVVPFSTGKHTLITFLLYLHRGRGTVWFDDAELVWGTSPTAVPATEATGTAASPFPLVDFYPGTVSFEKALYLIEGSPLHFLVYYRGNPAEAADLELVLDLPEAVSVLADFAAGDRPSGAAVVRGEARFRRYVLPVPEDRIRDRFTARAPHTLVLQADKAFAEQDLSWHLRAGDRQDKVRRIRVSCLPSLPPLRKTPRTFRLLAYYGFPLRNCPKEDAFDSLYQRMFGVYAAAGIRGCLAGTGGMTPARMQAVKNRHPSWSNGVIAGWPVVLSAYLDKQALAEHPAVDETGKEYAEYCVCPTYCVSADLMAKTSDRYFRIYSGRIDIDSLGEADWYVFDYEPHHKGWYNCFCDTCLDAFAEFAQTSRTTLDPSRVLRERREEWRRFRSRQNARMIGQFRAAAKRRNPRLAFGLCANVVSPWDPGLMDPHVDFHCPMIYYRHPARFFEVVDDACRSVSKPLMPTVSVADMPIPHWTSPAELKSQILATATAGGRGFMMWTGFEGLGGMDFVKIRECSDVIAELEDWFVDGSRVDDLVQATTSEANAYHGHRVHERGAGYLISLFNLSSKAPVRLSVRLAKSLPGRRSVRDPLRRVVFLAPDTAEPLWTGRDLREGFSLAIPALETVFVELGARDHPPEAGRRERLARADETEASAERYVLRAPRFASPPEIDGELTDAAWTMVPPVTRFLAAEDPAREQTAVRMGHDDRFLYVAVECRESRMAGLVGKHSERDSPVWADDCIEIFLRPPGQGAVYYQIVINSLGTVHDRKGWVDTTDGDETWDAGIRAAAASAEDRWAVECMVPFADLGAGAPGSAGRWGLNVCRERKASPAHGKQPENSSWFPCLGTFVPPRFGTMVFGDPPATK